ncbi:hypothetical protein K439DRAFT_335528 [Ramaria rubella]|nr:hypothetical protein K439DRAFT_335528 [Ramaria rubella]
MVTVHDKNLDETQFSCRLMTLGSFAQRRLRSRPGDSIVSMEEEDSQKKDGNSDGLVKKAEEEVPLNGNSSDDLLSALLPLESTVPPACSSQVSVSDGENGYIYCLFGVELTSRLFRSSVSDMRWEELSLRHHPSDVFQEPRSALPYRQFPGIAIFGPKEHRRLLLIGGRNHEGDIKRDDFWCLDVEKLVWSDFHIGGGSIPPSSQC